MIDTILPVQNIYKNEYQLLSNAGKELLINKKVAVVGLCRNCSSWIQNNINQIVETFENYTKEYKIILFENDSIDQTKEKITELTKNNSNIILLSETFNRPQFGTVKDRARTEALAEYRNILKDYVKKYYTDYDFVIVIDTDFKSFSQNGIYNSFGWFSRHNNIDAICGNSFEIKKIFTQNPSLWNYDCWAFRSTWWNDWQAVESTQFYNYNPMLWFGIWILPPGSPLVRINSGFGGCCIYKLSSYICGQYSGIDCEHVTFHYDLKSKNDQFSLYLNPSQIMLLN